MKKNLLLLGVSGKALVIAALTLGLALAACDTSGGGGDGGGDNPPIYTIDDTGPGGGKIFYYSAIGFKNTLTGKTCHYLEAAPADMSTNLAWVTTDFATTDIPNAARFTIGRGAANTAAILEVDSNAPAAKACVDYRGGGKNDWFLPSKDEVELMCVNEAVIGGIDNLRYYVSSSNYSANQVYSFKLRDYDWARGYKYSLYSVRAIRAF